MPDENPIIAVIVAELRRQCELPRVNLWVSLDSQNVANIDGPVDLAALAAAIEVASVKA